MKVGEYITCRIKNRSFRVSFAGVKSGDFVYVFESKSFVQFMTQEQYEDLLVDYDKKIDKASSDNDIECLQKMQKVRQQLELKVNKIRVPESKVIYISNRLKDKYCLDEEIIVECVEFGYRLWRPENYMILRVRVPRLPNIFFDGDARPLYFRDDTVNQVNALRIKTVIDVKYGEIVHLTLRDDYIEVRAEQQWSRKLEEFDAEGRQIKNDAYVENLDIFEASSHKTKVEKNGQIYIPRHFVDKCGLESPVMVVTRKDCVWLMSNSTFERMKNNERLISRLKK